MGTSLYDARFYGRGEQGMKHSAHAIVPTLVNYYNPASVIDVGCGEGWWLKEFASRGVPRLVGVEQNVDSIAAGEHVKYDLTQPLVMHERFDMCLCLEVAEHLPPESAETLVRSLCGLSDMVIFSAAIPHQGGNGHLNEQWQAYWANLFEGYGYGVTTWLRKMFWDDERIEPWYAQNMLVLKRDGECELQEISVVHPRMWAIYRGA